MGRFQPLSPPPAYATAPNYTLLVTRLPIKLVLPPEYDNDNDNDSSDPSTDKMQWPGGDRWPANREPEHAYPLTALTKKR